MNQYSKTLLIRVNIQIQNLYVGFKMNLQILWYALSQNEPFI